MDLQGTVAVLTHRIHTVFLLLNTFPMYLVPAAARSQLSSQCFCLWLVQTHSTLRSGTSLVSVPHCMPGFLRDPIPHILGATHVHLVVLPPWSIPFHFLKVGGMTQAQEREMVHLGMVGQQDWAAGTGAAWWLDREVVELKRRN